MLNREDITQYKEITGFHLGQIEKDYMQHILLLLLYRKTKDEFIFKGGTALQKTYGLNRFSEDLDFTLNTDRNIESILKYIVTGMNAFGCESAWKKKKEDNIGNTYAIKTKGPLFDGTEQSYVYIRLDISKREKVMLPFKTNTVIPIYKDLPPYLATVMDPSEIMAEKIRAILTRNNVRDIYDLWFLIQKKVKVSRSLIDAKLTYYKKVFTMDEFKESIEKNEKMWKQEMKQLIPQFIPFEDIKKGIFSQQFIEE